MSGDNKYKSLYSVLFRCITSHEVKKGLSTTLSVIDKGEEAIFQTFVSERNEIVLYWRHKVPYFDERKNAMIDHVSVVPIVMSPEEFDNNWKRC